MSQAFNVDVERGLPIHPPHFSSISCGPFQSYMQRLNTALFVGWKRFLGSTVGSMHPERKTVQIEDFRRGYPRFSVLIAAHKDFQIFRRFSNLRVRLLLLQQDKLSILEEKLNKIDSEESSALFLGNSRRDTNLERKNVLLEIDRALEKYDSLTKRGHEALGMETARSRFVLGLQNWINGNGCLARDETEYLKYRNDLLSIATADDGAVMKMESWVVNALIRWYKRFHQYHCSTFSRDPRVFIFSTSLPSLIARTLTALLVITLLLVPVIICNALTDVTSRIIVTIIATILFVTTLSSFIRAKTIEIFVAGAAYATVLTVFITGTNTPTP